ncbi:hypothetical protein SJAG_02211 [Schizosaccharomyces japonicus yFS275]|uniref:Conserved oligomeric Golgi complex subunit 5 n=1 Tax=Schizosaccharomyces japonicus (strain yFS275 / FY16936) TaxID=402676 RepID=B6K1V1_SCHJY|nr:hypothetical protein SJAG_02211 [Schizosaccharomyces japonicus yFS275]EEB07132.1 hypothetical protein SJAG_02211 [Schizosaccharomyces japonicus yFS275]
MNYHFDFSDYENASFDPQRQIEKLYASLGANNPTEEDRQVLVKKLQYSTNEITSQISQLILENKNELVDNFATIQEDEAQLSAFRQRLDNVQAAFGRIKAQVIDPCKEITPVHSALVNMNSTMTMLYWTNRLFGLLNTTETLLTPIDTPTWSSHFSNYLQAALSFKEVDTLQQKYPLVQRQNSVKALQGKVVRNRQKLVQKSVSFLMSQVDANSMADTDSLTQATSTLYLLDVHSLERVLKQALESLVQRAVTEFQKVFQLAPTTRRLLQSEATSAKVTDTLWSNFEDGWMNISEFATRCKRLEFAVEKSQVCQPDHENILSYLCSLHDFILHGANISIYFFKELAIAIDAKVQELNRRDPLVLKVFRQNSDRVVQIVELAIARSSSIIQSKDIRETSIILNSLRLLIPTTKDHQ